jgi:benzoate membrane transport protein
MRSSDPTGARGGRRRLRHRLQLPDPPDRRDLNAQAVGSGLTALALYLFAPIPIQVAVAAKLGLSPEETAGWIFAGWLPVGLGSIWLSLRHRQPIPIVMSVPAVIYLGTLGGELSFGELIGANLAAGALILGLALLGAGERIAAFVPLPIVVGMFAGTLLEWVLGIAEATFADAVVAGSAIAGYAAVRRLDRRWLPPVPVAAATGAVAVALLRGIDVDTVQWVSPDPGLGSASFSLSTAVAVGLPLALLTFGLGNLQGIGFLRGEGYPVPARRIAVATGWCSLVSAAFGGSPIGIGLGSTAIVAGHEAGPRQGRYWASLLAGTFAVGIAVAGGTIATVLGALPASYVTVIAGLASWSVFRGSMRGALAGEFRAGAVVAFAVAAVPFAVAGITSAFWAIPIGMAASLALERSDLRRIWRQARRADATC